MALSIPTWVGTLILLVLVFTILRALYYFYSLRLKHWQQNLRPGQMVHFYINEDRIPGEIRTRKGDFVSIHYCSHSYIIHIDDIYY